MQCDADFSQLFTGTPNSFHDEVSFYTLWKHQRTKGFLIFSGGIETGQLYVMNGLITIFIFPPFSYSAIYLTLQASLTFLSSLKRCKRKSISLNEVMCQIWQVLAFQKFFQKRFKSSQNSNENTFVRVSF